MDVGQSQSASFGWVLDLAPFFALAQIRSAMDKRLFSELGLSPETLKAVDKMGFEEASPIQTAVIPAILEGRDVIGQSSTGSGKTAAFAIPAIEKVDPKLKKVQVLILCPTRELALQVAEEVAKLSIFKKGIHAVPVFGGQPYERQLRALAAGVQIVIGTPGRVMDHMSRGTLRLDSLKFLVLDEADRMLDMGFRDDIEEILSGTPDSRQLLFFSATMPSAIKNLISRNANDPQWIKIEAQAQNAPQVDQVYFEVDRRSKLEALTRMIDVNDFRYGIIFCSTKLMVDDLDEHLHARGYAVDRLHGDISQTQRNKVMEKFRRRGFEFLIATDVAARGLDVDDLEVVCNFDLPNDAEDYTHRIGRTGRAGKTGKAFTFVSGRELYKLQSMVRYAKLNIRRERLPSLDEVEEARTNVFSERIRSTLDSKDFKPHDRMIDRLLDQGYASTDICSALIHLLQGNASGKPSGGGSAPAGKKAVPASKKEDSFSSPAPKRSTPAVMTKPAARSKKTHDAPDWVEKKAAAPRKPSGDSFEQSEPTRKSKYERPSRTGHESGMVTLYLNVGRKQLITPADVVGKVAGVTRLPANVVGAIDIHEGHLLVDVSEEHAKDITKKLAGVRMKGEVLKPSLATDAHKSG